MRPSRLRRRAVAWSILALAPSLHGAVVGAQATNSRTLLLEVHINGNNTEQVGSFLEQGGHIFASAEELRSLGLVAPVAETRGGLIDLAAISSEPATVNERAQIIALTVPIRAMATHQLGEKPATGQSIGVSPPGLLVNYDMTATAHSGSVDAYGITTARLFGGFGTLQSNFSVIRSRSRLRTTRLNTTYSFSDPDRLRTYSAGDVLSGALPYSRSLRIAGVQISTNFALRPDLVTYPLPIISGGAAVPSTVDVFVNGIRQLSTRVDAGPFSVPQLPIVSGAGQVSIAVRDGAGRQTVQTSSFYLSSALLQPGLSSFSFEAGAIRSNFGLKSGNYGPFAAVATGRYGITPWLTLDGHAEGSGRSALMTGGATLSLGKFAVASAAFGASNSPHGTGNQTFLSVERTARSYHVGLSALNSSRHYRDLGALVGDVPPRHVVQVNAGILFGRHGSLGVTYADIVQPPSKRLVAAGELRLLPALRTSVASATYSRELLGRAYLHLTGYSNLRHHDHAISAGISFRFGGHGAINASYESAARQAVVEASRPAIDPGDIGWRAYGTQGTSSRMLGELYYRGEAAELALGVDTGQGQAAVQAAVRGSVVMMAGSVFTSTTITDGFAVVDAQGFGNVAVTLNNRPAGRTSKDGKLLVPGLASYQRNTISIDPGDLPLDTRWDRLDAQVSTSDRAGTIARFGVRRQQDVLVTVHLANGELLPVRSRIAVDGRDPENEAGYDGQVYFTNLEGQHELQATLPDGTRCRAAIVVPSKSSWPTLIEATCG